MNGPSSCAGGRASGPRHPFAPDVFRQIYGRDPARFFALIASRADCLAGQTYAPGGGVCPASQCGNGMVERAEDCDDGNLVDGDGCSAACTFEEPAAQAAQRYVR